MSTPYDTDLSELKDQDLELKIQELNKKYHTAYRLGKPELLTQISMFVTMYKQELSRRNQERMKKELGGDLGQLINVD